MDDGKLTIDDGPSTIADNGNGNVRRIRRSNGYSVINLPGFYD